MLFFVFGLPGGFATWCEQVVAALVRRAGGAGGLIRGDTLEQIAAGAIATGTSQGVVSSRQPGGRLRATLLETGAPFVVALDDPRAALIELVLGREVGLPDAVQQLASSCAALRGLASAPGALTLHGDTEAPPDADTIARIASHLRLAVDEAGIAELADALAPPVAAEGQLDAVAWWNGLELDEQELALGALGPFIDTAAIDTTAIDSAANSAPFSVSWGPELFFLADRPGERATGPIDITGRARCLLHGPYIILPAGSWSLSLSALFSSEAADYEFDAEVWAERVLAQGTLRPRQGSAAVTLDFALDEATEQPLAIRLSSRRAAFDGAIIGVVATLVQEPAGG
jgi:hypothetical protein